MAVIILSESPPARASTGSAVHFPSEQSPMRKLFCIVVLTLCLPVVASMECGGFVAVAGHTQTSDGRTVYCWPCGCPKHPECVCDEGEPAGPCDEPLARPA